MNKVKVLVEGYAKVSKDGTWDATSSTPQTLKLSRSHALKIADWIIPGHGKVFRVSKNLTS